MREAIEVFAGPDTRLEKARALADLGALLTTARTVEGHLTNVFTKLDVKARTALPAALAAPTRAVRA